MPSGPRPARLSSRDRAAALPLSWSVPLQPIQPALRADALVVERHAVQGAVAARLDLEDRLLVLVHEPVLDGVAHLSGLPLSVALLLQVPRPQSPCLRARVVRLRRVVLGGEPLDAPTIRADHPAVDA